MAIGCIDVGLQFVPFMTLTLQIRGRSEYPPERLALSPKTLSPLFPEGGMHNADLLTWRPYVHNFDQTEE
jgi:hypothetical protein